MQAEKDQTTNVNIFDSANSRTSSSKVFTKDEIDIVMCGLSCSFKIVSIILFLCLSLLTEQKLLTFNLVVVLISVDFWVSKKLTGRKLVGLRWWNSLTETGEEQWVFESCDSHRTLNSINKYTFWISNLINLSFWFVISLVLLGFLNFFWFALTIYCAFLSGINTACYMRCRGPHQKLLFTILNKLGIKSMKQEGNHVVQSQKGVKGTQEDPQPIFND